MTNQQLATIHGISAQAVGRWSAERKRRAIIEANAVVNPEVKKLIGELSGLCYAAGCATPHKFMIEIMEDTFYVWNGVAYIANAACLNAYELQGAIAKLEDMIYG